MYCHKILLIKKKINFLRRLTMNMSRTMPIVDSRDCGPVAESWHPETSIDSCQWESTERHHLRSCRRQSTVEKSQPAAQNNPLTSHRLSHWLGMFLQGGACRTENFRHVYKFEWHAFTSTQRPRLQTWWEQSLMANWHEDLKNQSKQITSQMTPPSLGKLTLEISREGISLTMC